MDRMDHTEVSVGVHHGEKGLNSPPLNKTATWEPRLTGPRAHAVSNAHTASLGFNSFPVLFSTLTTELLPGGTALKSHCAISGEC